MNKKVLALICTAALAVGALAGCGNSKTETKEETVGVNVTTSQVVISDIDTTATYTGSLTTDNFA